MREEVELQAAPGFVAPELRAEFPGLRLDWVTVKTALGPSPKELRRRLAELSSRYRGPSVIAMRTKPIPHAYRTFYRQIGLDPDVDRVPIEAAGVARLMQGQFVSKDVLADACLIALIETGVPIWALDAELVDAGGLGIRATVAGERLGTAEAGDHLPAGRLAVADAHHVHALLFGELAPGHAVTPRSKRAVLFSVGVDGVPAIHVEEALWVCVEALNSG